MKRYSLHAILFFSILLSSCAGPAQTTPMAAEASAEPTPLPSPTSAPTEQAATPLPAIFSSEMMTAENPLCTPESEGGPFILTCHENGIQFSQSESRRGTDVIIRRSIEADAEGFELNASTTSIPADPARLDKNQLGFYFMTDGGRTFALRLEGQFFNFEEWTVENGKEKILTFNQTYAPDLQPAGRENSLKLQCSAANCDFYSADVLVGRLPLPEGIRFTAMGVFAASPWDEKFGSVAFSSLEIREHDNAGKEMEPYVLADDLTADHGTFAKMGLSGAFSEFEADGFHFSPVIPYGYYWAKAGPALRNSSIAATIEMDFTPGVSATRYGGVVCRSSNEGMVMAVLRADGTYTIFRDSIRRAFAMLATGAIPEISEGRSAHRVQLECVDDLITLWIDGQVVESFTDTRYGIRYGRNGLYTKAGGLAYSDAIIFSGLEITEIR